MGGEGGGGIYHSIYDTFTWYTRFSDSKFEYGRTLTQTAGTLTMRLSEAQVLPFEFTNLAETIGNYLDEVTSLPKEGVELQPLRQAIDRFRVSAIDYDRALRRAAERGRIPADRTAELRELNRLLFHSERQLMAKEGLPRRPWYRHQIYAPGFYTGYGVKTLPGVREAIEQKNWTEASAQVVVIARTIDTLTSHLHLAASRLAP